MEGKRCFYRSVDGDSMSIDFQDLFNNMKCEMKCVSIEKYLIPNILN